MDPPVLNQINLTGGSDTGISDNDRLTNLSKPEVSFNSEPGLTVYVQDKNKESWVADPSTNEIFIVNDEVIQAVDRVEDESFQSVSENIIHVKRGK